ncbi:MAG: DUF1643 domain-containing protein [Phycisphaerae bacterium]|jgi:hypothetical protein
MKYIYAGAIFNPDHKYRYELCRRWGYGGRNINFVGLNPSTANETTDDPTIRRCVGFAQAWGFDEMHMLNLFALVSSDPFALCSTKIDPIGLENDSYLRCLNPETIVIAWGSWGKLRVNTIKDRVRTVLGYFDNPYCLGRNKDGEPKHPLYLPGDTKLILYK